MDAETLQDTFDRLDCDDSGVISPENIRALLGTDATDDRVRRMISDGDLKRNGVVDFDEFLDVMSPPKKAAAAGGGVFF